MTDEKTKGQLLGELFEKHLGPGIVKTIPFTNDDVPKFLKKRIEYEKRCKEIKFVVKAVTTQGEGIDMPKNKRSPEEVREGLRKALEKSCKPEECFTKCITEDDEARARREEIELFLRQTDEFFERSSNVCLLIG